MRHVLVILALLAATPAWADEQDDFIMTIDAGRLGAMMNQSQEILKLPSDPASSDGSTETWAVLRRAVLEYQRLLPVACARHAVAKDVCEPAFYAPRWLADVSRPKPDVLRARIDEAQGHVSALWGGLCDRLPKPHDESLCQLE
jgi:hypothetical protein